MAKAADFGAHANRYYPLEVSHFKSTLDSRLLEALWNKYWVKTLSSSPLATNRDYGTKQIQDLAGKIKAVRTASQNNKNGMARIKDDGPDSTSMDIIVKASEKIAMEEKVGLMALSVKEKVFASDVLTDPDIDAGGVKLSDSETMAS
ncbi:hypothetical protein LTR28_010549 [Elasticomyces elasticus]|nr:hypothetical protein LTR28_010549 [Elasticomyces elasticus]